MQRLKYLDDWALEILSARRSQLNARFRGWDDAVADSIRGLPFFTPYRARFRWVDADLLRRLHVHLRGARCESRVWDGLIRSLDHALPDEVANDLIDRDIAISMLGHSRQSDAVMWRLAPLVEEAMVTMAREIYTRPVRNVEELRQVLADFPDSWMLLNSLSHARPSSPEKRAAFESAIESHPQRDRFLQNSPNDVEPTDEQRAARWEIARPLNGEAAILHALNLYGSDHILDLARDRDTPLEVLRDLATVRGIDSAAAIRHAARINLRSHGLDPDDLPEDESL